MTKLKTEWQSFLNDCMSSVIIDENIANQKDLENMFDILRYEYEHKWKKDRVMISQLKKEMESTEDIYENKYCAQRNEYEQLLKAYNELFEQQQKLKQRNEFLEESTKDLYRQKSEFIHEIEILERANEVLKYRTILAQNKVLSLKKINKQYAEFMELIHIKIQQNVYGLVHERSIIVKVEQITPSNDDNDCKSEEDDMSADLMIKYEKWKSMLEKDFNALSDQTLFVNKMKSEYHELQEEYEKIQHKTIKNKATQTHFVYNLEVKFAQKFAFS